MRPQKLRRALARQRLQLVEHGELSTHGPGWRHRSRNLHGRVFQARFARAQGPHND